MKKPKNRSYDVTVSYVRPSGGAPVSVEYEVTEVSSRNEAVRQARDALMNDARRKVSRIIDHVAIDKTPTPPKPQMIRAGQMVSVSIPFTGVVHHRDDGRVELLGPPIGPNGERSHRRMSREMLEELTGRPLEPAPRRTRTEIVSIYPSGEQYVAGSPVRNSSYGVKNLVQVRITRYVDNGELVSKEFV